MKRKRSLVNLGTGRVRPFKRTKFRAPRRILSSGTAPLATRGWTGTPLLGSIMERKVSDLAPAIYNVITAGNFVLLHCPILGTDYTARIGRKTVINSVYIKGKVYLACDLVPTTPVAVPGQKCRFILFVDNQPNGAAPAVTDLLNNASGVNAQLNLNNRDRFRILKDKTFVFDPYILSTTATQAVAGFNHTISNFKMFKRCKIETIFNATNGGTIADINSGALYMFWVGEQVAGTLQVNFEGTTRVRFLDS